MWCGWFVLGFIFYDKVIWLKIEGWIIFFVGNFVLVLGEK